MKSSGACCVLLCSAAFLFTGCGTSADKSSAELSGNSVEESLPGEKNLVTLGDSISYGYSLENPEQQRYSALLTTRLSSSDDVVWHDYNYAVSGDDSSDLFKRLQDGRAMRLPSADMIVICIGANNILSAYTNYLQELAGGFDFESADSADMENLQSEILEGMEHNTQAYANLQSNLEDGLQRLQQDLESIYSFVRSRNEEAPIYLLNVYNPFVESTENPLPQSDEPLSAVADREVGRCNAILEDFCNKHDDIIPVDLYTAFAQCEHPPIIGNNGTEGLALDPHPNAEGQQIIADSLFSVMRPDEA